jgi:hypothetical protein
MALQATARTTAHPLPVQILVDGRDVAAETLITNACYTLVIQTAIPQPEIPVEIHSVYVACPALRPGSRTP